MSTTVDERVVSMQFDNRNFEQNATTTMSTLDKLKQKLNLSGASKGLAEVEAAAKSCNLNPICNAAETVGIKFDAMSIMAKRALENIVDSAYAAGKKIVSALTIDPVKSGLQEYETQINSVQTILANTQSKGSTLADVNAALDELNKYADLTIYNFTEMTRNIGTFTAAGVGLETSVNAIKGIANLAAISGSTSQQASTAMYQLSQALASGTVKLMDWNSVVNAGMGGQVFQDALKETARVHGIAIDSMIEEQGSFRETLSEGWLTSEILTETLQKFTLTTEGLTEAEIEANREMLRAKGYTEDQIEEIFKLGNTATEAATKVKTFSQMWDVLKEAAQSGWSQTWRIVIGDFEEAKALLTPLTDLFTGIIQRMSDWRNNILEFALAFASPLESIKEKLSGITSTVGKVTSSVSSVTDALAYYQDVVNKVWRGDYNNWGDSLDRRDLLTAAGYNPQVVQELVNKGYQYKLTMDDVNAAQEKFGVTLSSTSDEVENTTSSIAELTDEQLKQAGLTEDEISMYRALEAEAGRLGISVTTLADRMSKFEGRTILLKSLENIGGTILDIARVFKEAWKEIFDVPTVGELAVKLYMLIDSFHKLSARLRITDKATGELNATGEKLKRVFKGVIAVLDVVRTIAGGALSVAFSVLKAILGEFDKGILDLAANIGDAIVEFDNWFKSIFDIQGLISAVVPYIVEAAKVVANWIESIKNSEAFTSFKKKIEETTTAIGDWIEGIKDADNIAKYLGSGLGKGLGTAISMIANAIKGLFSTISSAFSGGVDTSFLQPIINFFSSFIDSLTEAVGIDLSWFDEIAQKIKDLGSAISGTESFQSFISSISNAASAVKEWFAGLKETDDLGSYIVAGLINGIKNGIPTAVSAIVSLGTALWEGFCNFFNMHSPSVLMMTAGAMIIAGLIIGIKNMFPSLGDSLDGLSFFGESAIGGFIDGIKNKLGDVRTVLGTFAYGIVDFVRNLDLGKVFAILGSTAILSFVFSVSKAIFSLSKVFKGAGRVLEESAYLINSVRYAIDTFSKAIAGVGKAVKNSLNAMAIKNIAIAVAILVGSVIALAYVAKDDSVDLAAATGVVFSLAAILAGLFVALNKISSAGQTTVIDLGKVTAGIFAIAAAILVMAIAAKLIGGMKPEEFEQATVGLFVLAGIIAGLILATRALSKNVTGDVSSGMEDVGKMLLKVAAAMLVMVVATKLIGGMKPEEFEQGLLGLVVLTAIVAALMLATKALSKNASGDISSGISDVGKMLFKIAAAMLVMAVAAKMIGGMKPEEFEQAVVGLFVLAALMAGLMLATKAITNDKTGDLSSGMSDVGKMLLEIAAAMLVMAIAAKIIAGMTWDEMKKAGIGLLVLAGIMAGLMWATKLIVKTGKGQLSTGINNIGLMLLEIAAGILVLAIAAKLIASMSFDDLKKAVVGIIVLAGVMVGLIWATKLVAKTDKGNISNNLQKLGIMLLEIAAAILVLAVAAKLIATMKVGELIKGVAGIVALAGVMVGLMAATKLAGGNQTKELALSILAMAAAIAVMAGAVALLSLLDPAKLAVATACLGALMAVFALMISQAKNAAGALAPLIVMVAAIAVMATAIYALSNIENQDAAIKSAIALSTLVLAMSVALLLLKNVGKSIGGALGGVIALLAIAVPLLAFVGILYLMQNVQNAMSNVKALAALLAALTVCLIPLTIIGSFGAAALIGVVALLAIAVPLLAFIGILYLMEGIQNAEANVKLLVGFMAAMTGLLVILAIVGPLAIIGLTALTALTALMVAIGVLAAGIGALKLQEFLTTGIDTLKQLASGIGEIIGCFVSGLLVGATSGLPDVGSNLSMFITNALPFITLVKLVDDSVLTGVGILSASIIALTAADFISGVLNFGDVSGSFAELGTALSQFMLNAMPFILLASTIDPSVCTAVSSIADMILTITASSVLDGISSFLFGDSSLEDFGAKLVPFGTALKSFSDEVTGINVEAVSTAAEAGKALAEMAKEAPNEGGLIGWFAGENSLASFGDQLVVFGTSLKAFSDSVIGLDSEAVSTAAEAGKVLVEMAKEAPNEGGLIGWFAGENSLAAFGDNIVSFGEDLKTFADSVIGLDSEAVSIAAEAGKTLAEMANTVPDSGGLLAWFAGDNSLASFGDNIASFGEDLKRFSDNVVGIDTEAVSAAVTAGKALVDMANVVPTEGGIESWFGGGNSLSAFGDNIAGFGADLKVFADSVSGIDSLAVGAATSAARSLVDMANTIPEDMYLEDFGDEVSVFGEDMADFSDDVSGSIDSEGIKAAVSGARSVASLASYLGTIDLNVLSDFADYLTELGSVSFDEFIEGFSGAADTISSSATSAVDAVVSVLTSMTSAIKDKYDTFKMCGKALTNMLLTGAKENKEGIKTNFTNAITGAITAIRLKYWSMYYAGQYLGDGLVAGINSRKWSAYNAGYALGQAAVQGEKDGQQSQSPSKLTIKAGKWFGEGLVIGIERMTSDVYNAGHDLGDTAVKSMSKTLSRISSLVDSNIDTQPTIRPVLDLSDIRSGAGEIGSMFNMTPSVGVMTNVGAISSMMAYRQNEVTNGDVVSAIKDLGRKIGDASGNTYNVNGITYDDGSNVSNAIRDLVRAARIERRM